MEKIQVTCEMEVKMCIRDRSSPALFSYFIHKK